MSRESEEVVLRRIEATRERMGETIERIGDQVHPDRVQHELKTRARNQVDELKYNAKRKAKNTMDDVQHEVRETGRGLWDTIRDNPVPAGMVGVGLAWLVANGSRHSDDTTYRSSAYPFDRTTARSQPVPNRYRPVGSASYAYEDDTAYEDDFDDDSSTMGDAADQVRTKSSDAMDDAREKGQHAAHAAREKGEDLADTAREKGQQATDAARERMQSARHGMRQAGSTARGWASDAEYRARRAERRVEHAVQDNPFAAGAVAMALGLAAGLMIPETDREREMMGPARERLKDQAETQARNAANKAHDIARETASKSAKRAVDEAWSEAGVGSDDSDDSEQRMAAEGNAASQNSAVREPGR